MKAGEFIIYSLSRHFDCKLGACRWILLKYIKEKQTTQFHLKVNFQLSYSYNNNYPVYGNKIFSATPA